MAANSKDVIKAISDIYYSKYFSIEKQFLTTVPPIIYHYTNISSLISIVENRRLWASRAEYLNDANEFRYGLDICKDELNKIASAGPEYKSFVDTSNRALETATLSPFVTCFCRDGDLLSQWRAYSAHGQGLSIGFHSASLSKLDRARLRNVIYDRTAQSKFHSQHIRLLADAFIASGANLNDNEVWIDLVGYIGALERAAAIMKDVAFSEESEARMFVSDWSVDPQEIRFRSRNNLIIPYIELSLDQISDLGIGEIIVGPGPDPDIRTKNIERFLQIRNHERVSVKLSKCQLRQ